MMIVGSVVSAFQTRLRSENFSCVQNFSGNEKFGLNGWAEQLLFKRLRAAARKDPCQETTNMISADNTFSEPGSSPNYEPRRLR